MTETNQERDERLIAERDAAIFQLAEWSVRTQQEYYERTGWRSPDHIGSQPYLCPYTIHELLDKAISDLKSRRNGGDDDQQ